MSTCPAHPGLFLAPCTGLGATSDLLEVRSRRRLTVCGALLQFNAGGVLFPASRAVKVQETTPAALFV